MKKIIFMAIGTLVWMLPAKAQVSESADMTLTIEKDPTPVQVAVSGFADLNLTYNADTGEFDTDEVSWPMCLYSYEDEFDMTVSDGGQFNRVFFSAASMTTSEVLRFTMQLWGRSSAGTLDGRLLPSNVQTNRAYVVDIADHKQDEQCSSHLNAQFQLSFLNLADIADTISAGSTETFSQLITITLEPRL